ncbi:hypothetical protein PAAG_05636 [Paracoccidioides lutzii Pb01]|uniref:Extracellular membrane protein CFEM domain-containing protein n=1 Tax=Paracoccidioides lutzii (strain ATCC MYA-826 / Pb01) TaxID=502779 RepID=C1H4E3_PARBA|nr:hypothetical protein PAAG_05636 [Paracoccidioides lutzii Pb01]EEH34587.1 hypothetical protein PAAG_05636 [Paracoccidioides lutzii Pb01]
MKFFTLMALAGLFASAAALPQENPATTTTTSLSPQLMCASSCPSSSVCCKASCLGVPCPDNSMANRTNQCAMSCNQGSGSPSDIQNYAMCQSSCIQAFFLGSSTAPTPSSTGSASTTTSPPNGTSTGNFQTTPSGGAGVINVQLGSFAAGIVGLLMAAVVL